MTLLSPFTSPVHGLVDTATESAPAAPSPVSLGLGLPVRVSEQGTAGGGGPATIISADCMRCNRSAVSVWTTTAEAKQCTRGDSPDGKNAALDRPGDGALSTCKETSPQPSLTCPYLLADVQYSTPEQREETRRQVIDARLVIFKPWVRDAVDYSAIWSVQLHRFTSFVQFERRMLPPLIPANELDRNRNVSDPWHWNLQTD